MTLWPKTPVKRALVILGLVVVLLVVALLADGLLLNARVTRVSVDFPTTQDGTTWVMVGSDSRSALPPGPHWYGSARLSPGVHADAVVVIHQGPHGTSLLSIPRDVLVSPQQGEISRLTLTFDQGPQQLVDGLCRSLNIPATHLVVITMNGFAAAVNDLGGVTITNPAPVRDLDSGLDLPTVGRVHLGGVQALALVRSRFPQTLTPSGWVPATSTAGDSDRTRWVGALFHALATEAHHQQHNPLVLQSLAWDLTGSLTVDSHTSLLGLMGLNLDGASLRDLPVRDLGANGIGATVDPATHRALAAAGFTQRCHPA